MNVKRIVAIFSLLVTASAFADSDVTVFHVTPKVLMSQMNIPQNWKVNHNTYDFDIENETNSPITVVVNVKTLSFPKNVSLLTSGECGVSEVQPSQSITCSIYPTGHLELAYNIYPAPDVIPTNVIEGTFTIVKG